MRLMCSSYTFITSSLCEVTGKVCETTIQGWEKVGTESAVANVCILLADGNGNNGWMV